MDSEEEGFYEYYSGDDTGTDTDGEDSTAGTSMSEDDDSSGDSSSSDSDSDSEIDEEGEKRRVDLIGGEVALFSDPDGNENVSLSIYVQSASYVYTVLRPGGPLNVESIMALFDHPLNDTLPDGSDIVDACHLHYSDCDGVHIVNRDGYIAESGFLYEEGLTRIEAFQSAVRESPFLASFEVDTAHRYCNGVVLWGQTSFPINMATLSTDTEIRCSEVSGSRITFRFDDDFDRNDDDEQWETSKGTYDMHKTVIKTHVNGFVIMLVEGRDANDPDATLCSIDRLWDLLRKHNGTGDSEWQPYGQPYLFPLQSADSITPEQSEPHTEAQ